MFVSLRETSLFFLFLSENRTAPSRGFFFAFALKASETHDLSFQDTHHNKGYSEKCTFQREGCCMSSVKKCRCSVETVHYVIYVVFFYYYYLKTNELKHILPHLKVINYILKTECLTKVNYWLLIFDFMPLLHLMLGVQT